MGARKRQKACSGCGAGIRSGLDRCPLCGADAGLPTGEGIEDVEDYQATLRKLQDELKKLRKQSA